MIYVIVAQPRTSDVDLRAIDTEKPGRVVPADRAQPVVAELQAAQGLELAERHERVGLDTTMAFTDFFEQLAPYPPALLPRLRELGLAGKVLLGSDFPNIPYPYAHQLESLRRLQLGDDWLRAVCWHNAARLFGLDGA